MTSYTVTTSNYKPKTVPCFTCGKDSTTGNYRFDFINHKHGEICSHCNQYLDPKEAN